MSQLTIEFPLSNSSVTLKGDELRVDLGNSVWLTTLAPRWLKSVQAAKLQLVMEIEGSPHDEPSRSPIK
jgi:hypothetical protein